MKRVPEKSARKAKKDQPITARPRVKRVNVAHPTVPGAVESVDRIVDGTANTIDAMFKRQQIDAAQKRAAERLRNAWETIHGSVGGVMDFDRVRGGNAGSMMPALAYRDAADILLEAKKKLYALDHKVLDLVVCRGYRIDSAAAIIHRQEPSRQQKERIGERFREGLRELADLWYPANQGDKDNMRVYHVPDADPALHHFTAEAGRRQIPVDHAHAGGRKVFRKG